MGRLPVSTESGSTVSYELFVLPKAQRQINALPNKDRQRIIEKINSLRQNPRPSGARKLVDTDEFYRVRVGQYRIIYAPFDQLLFLLVVTVGRRRDVYERLREKFNKDKLLAIINTREH
jgi:mRNA interferase RelE/StbE